MENCPLVGANEVVADETTLESTEEEVIQLTEEVSEPKPKDGPSGKSLKSDAPYRIEK